MKIGHTTQDQATVVTLAGELDYQSRNELDHLIQERLTSHEPDVVIDMTEVERVDSDGLEVLLEIEARTGEMLGQLRLVGLNRELQTVLNITRLDSTFTCLPDIPAAMESLKV